MAGIASNGKLDISSISEEDIITFYDKSANKSFSWIKINVEEKIFMIKNRPYVVIKFNEGCFAGLPEGASSKDIGNALMFYSSALKATKEQTQPGNGGNSGGGGNGNGGNEENGYGSGEGDTPGEEKNKPAEVKTICGNINYSDLEEAQKGVDSTSINDRGFQAAALLPSAAVIPMRSNILTYGPYASRNFSTSNGGTNIEVNQDLAPWVLGSIEAMNNMGNLLVDYAAIGLVRSETGSVTIPGLPDIQSLGDTMNGAGPNLTGVNFSFGHGGMTTTLEFRTYTPKFGNLTRPVLDKLKSINKNKIEQLRFLRNTLISQNKIDRKINRYNTIKKKIDGDQKPDANKASLNRVIVGEIYNFTTDNQRTVVGTETLGKSSVQMALDYSKKAYMSWDGILGPVSLNGAGDLPRFTIKAPVCQNTWSPILPFPPFIGSSNNFGGGTGGDTGNGTGGDTGNGTGGSLNKLEITQRYLNPLTNSSDVASLHHKGSGAGHVIDLVGRENEVPKSGVMTHFYKKDDSARYSSDYRFVGLRGPLVLHSWGYDLDGKPIPNEADNDDDTKSGNFTNGKLTDRFLKDWLQKPSSWPVAPVDLRFDRARGVWVSPQPYTIVTAKLNEDLLPYKTANASLINYYKTLYDSDGNEIKTTTEGDQKDPNTEEEKYEWVLISASCKHQCGGTDTSTNNLGTQIITDVLMNTSSDSKDYGGEIGIVIKGCLIPDKSHWCVNGVAMRFLKDPSSFIDSPIKPSHDTLNASISIEERLGKKYIGGTMVYAYYDTFNNSYIILEYYDNTDTQGVIYGEYSCKDGQFLVQGSSKPIKIGSKINVNDRLDFCNCNEITTGDLENPIVIRVLPATGCLS